MKILHLIGSQTSEYYFCVSAMYGVGCINSFENDTHWILQAHLDGKWSVHKSLPQPLTQADLQNSSVRKVSLAKAMIMIEGEGEGEDEFQNDGKPDIVQSHMFDYHGMVTCREIATLLDLPMVGSPSNVMALTTDKWQTRVIVESMGVPVPKAQLLRRGDAIIDMVPPFILKPCREDNSMGISLVEDESQVEAALDAAFRFDDLVLCERFIPLGRELRVGVVESAEDPDELEMLPPIEYHLPQSKPIRTSADKLTESTEEDEDGSEEKKNEDLSMVVLGNDSNNKKKPVSLKFTPVNRKVAPEDINETLRAKLYDMAITSHRALGLKHYSLYDVRVDPDGNPYFIEASAYCSFAPSSTIVMMGTGEGKYPHPSDLFYRFAKRAIAEHASFSAVAKSGQQQTHGMRRKVAMF